jgi:Domain of unknown function (DUF4177)
MRWEYKTLQIDAKGIFSVTVDEPGLEKKLAQLGEEGWELVTAHPIPNSAAFIYTFKRPKTS